jgi:hypothetical protein
MVKKRPTVKITLSVPEGIHDIVRCEAILTKREIKELYLEKITIAIDLFAIQGGELCEQAGNRLECKG